MRFAEILLRLGCSLVGWMVLIAYVLWLAVVSRMECGEGLEDLLALLMFAGPAASLMTVFILATRRMPDVHSILRWIAVFPLLMFPAAALVIFRYSRSVYLDSQAYCGTAEPTMPQLLWPVVQVASLLLIVGVVAIAFRQLEKDVQ